MNLSPLLPERLSGLSVAEIERLPVRYGNRETPLAELFEVEDGARERLVILGGHARLDRIGAGMGGGEIRVEGDAGDELGAEMSGGRLLVTGSAGRLAATGMREGLISIGGNVDQHAGSCRAGGRYGMRGGVLRVEGRLGERAGERMRRGLIVAARAGDFVGSFLLAGTILVQGSCGRDPGYAMKRGSLVLAEPPASLLPTFVDCGRNRFEWPAILLRELRHRGIDIEWPGLYLRRHVGCGSAGGKGEILIVDG